MLDYEEAFDPAMTELQKENVKIKAEDYLQKVGLVRPSYIAFTTRLPNAKAIVTFFDQRMQELYESKKLDEIYKKWYGLLKIQDTHPKYMRTAADLPQRQ